MFFALINFFWAFPLIKQQLVLLAIDLSIFTYRMIEFAK